MTKQSRNYYIYILTNKNNTVLYIGVTSNLVKRIYEHKYKFVSSFTSKYNINKLVYYETCDDPESAITREKQLKAGPRKRKLALIVKDNPKYRDLYEEIATA